MLDWVRRRHDHHLGTAISNDLPEASIGTKNFSVGCEPYVEKKYITCWRQRIEDTHFGKERRQESDIGFDKGPGLVSPKIQESNRWR